MANMANTEYRVRGDRKAVADLWEKLQTLGVNKKDVWLCDLAKAYGIDYEKKGFSVRGNIYWADFEEDEENDEALLSFSTETAWDACEELFEAVNEALGDALSISYREVECGCGIYYVHDEFDFFPEECCVSADGEPFGNLCEDPFDSISDAIKLWVSLTGIPQGDRTEEEMVEFINGYDYGEDDTYFYIHPFTFV